MFDLHIGTTSEFVCISLPAPTLSKDWVETEVKICVPGFNARLLLWIEEEDIFDFAKELEALYGNLNGSAHFSHRDGQLELDLVGDGLGGVLVKGTAWAKAASWAQALHENKLVFEYHIDQTYLSTPLSELYQFLSLATGKSV